MVHIPWIICPFFVHVVVRPGKSESLARLSALSEAKKFFPPHPVRQMRLSSAQIVPDLEGRFRRRASTFVSLAASQNFGRMKIRDLAYWLAANKFLDSPQYGPERGHNGRLLKKYGDGRILRESDRAIQAMRDGDLDPVDSANRTVDYMRGHGLSNGTIRMTRLTICRFLLYSRLGLDPYDLKIAVKNLPRVWVNLKRTPTREQVRSILLACDLRMKTLFSIMISTGARLGETISIRKDQINFSKMPVEVSLKANKVYRNRIVFLCSETVMLLKEYLKTRKRNYQHIFSGYDDITNKAIDRPMRIGVAWNYFKRIRDGLGMTEKYDKRHYFYRPSCFRVLNLDILKSSGYPADWAEYLVGHSISFQASYIPSTSSLAKAWIKYDSQFCFLKTESPETVDGQVMPPPTVKSNSDLLRAFDKVEPTSSVYRPRTTHWRTKNFDYVKTHIQSTGYDQAIADGFSIFDSSPSGVRVFRKRFRGGKQWMKSINRTLTHKHTDFKDHAKPI